jgi:aminopeptidase N
MKKPILASLFTFFFLFSMAQFNQTEKDFEGYCKHHDHAHLLKNEYMQFRSSNPLLDQYDVKFYFIDINIENYTTDISGNATVDAVVTAPVLDTFMLELHQNMNVDSILVNGNLQPFSHQGDELLVLLDDPLNEGDFISVQVFYAGTPPGGSFFVGVANGYSNTWDKNVTWTLSEPYAAKDWWPAKQELTDKADSSWVFLTTDENNLAGSQGLLTAVTPMPDNKLRYEWKSQYPIAYYLLSFAVAEYQEYNIYAHPEGLGDSVLIQNFIYDSPGCLAFYQDDIDQTAEFVELFSDLYTMYPFAEEKYGHCQTQLGGGMEHQTMSTMGGFSFGLVAHELGHMWFGDNVTCATWSDIWINEGFATYSDYLANEYVLGSGAAKAWLAGRHDHVKQQPGGSVYVPPSQLGNIWRIFDGRLSYSKGALIIHMIRHELNDDELFFQVMRDFQVMYTDTSATGMDFKGVLEDVSGQDFTQFFDQWYFGEGYPIFDITWNQDADSLYVNSTQNSSTNVTTLFQMTLPLYVEFDDGSDTIYRLFQETNLDHFTIAIDQPVTDMMLDPDLWILHKLSSLVVGLDDIENPVYFTVGPNPFSDRLNIYSSFEPGNDHTVVVTDLAGRRVLEETLTGNVTTLSVGELSSGLYLVKVSDGGNEMTRKLLKR